MTLKVIIHEAAEGGYWGEVPALPGCVSQGESVDELLVNVREAVAGWLDADESEFELAGSDRLLELSF